MLKKKPWDNFREIMIEAEALSRLATKEGNHAEARSYKQIAAEARQEAIRLARSHYASHYAEIDEILTRAPKPCANS